MVINAMVYTFVYTFLTIGGGALSSFTPWLNVPKGVYYYYNRFWLAPSMLGCWILSAGVAYLLSRLVSGKGSYDDTLGVFGFGITVATFFSALHDQRWYEVQLNTPWTTIFKKK
jgi:hypothetical protein